MDPKFPDFQVPDFQISRNLAWAGLGPGRAIKIAAALLKQSHASKLSLAEIVLQEGLALVQDQD